MAKNNSPEQVFEVQEIVVADYAKQRQDNVDELLKGHAEIPENIDANAIRNLANSMQAKVKLIETGAIKGID